MTTTINADSSNGFKVTADTSSILALQTNGTTAISIDASQAVSFTNAPTVTGGTANGVAYLNGSKVLTTGSALVFDGTNLGLGVTPPTSTDAGNITIKGGSTLNFSTASGNMAANATFNSGWKYIATAAAVKYTQSGAEHQWFNAASGTAGNAITFTQAMTLDASGNLGIGATSPAKKLDVYLGTTGTVGQYLRNTTINLLSQIDGTSSAQFGTETSHPLVFLTANTERARIDSSGNLLVGKTALNLAVGTSIDANTSTGSGVRVVSSATTASADGFQMYSTGTSTYRFAVGFNGTISAVSTVISSISDARLKENVRDLNVGLSEIMALKPRLYDWKEGKGADIKNARGFIAQEFEIVFPDLIDESRDPAPEGEGPYKAVRADLIPVLVKAIQEQQALITQLQADVAALKGA